MKENQLWHLLLPLSAKRNALVCIDLIHIKSQEKCASRLKAVFFLMKKHLT